MSILERERVEEVVAPKEVTVADVLERAADLLGEFGWTQGSEGLPGYLDHGRHPLCYLGAIAQASYDFGLRPGLGVTQMAWAASFTGEDYVTAYCWNDRPRRTKEEVVAALRTAAEKARQS